jgi:NAD(P)-dependent dehydrogenase (short-subunit alcohol dehydrogenase family)
MTLNGKTVLITGGARRLGRQFSMAVANAGANVIIHHAHSPEQALQTAHQVEGVGSKAWILEADLSRLDMIPEFIEKAWNISPFYALVNSASIFEPLGAKEVTLPDWQRHIDINLTAPVFLSKYFASYLGEDNLGRIVNILDWRAIRPGEDHFPYTISKAALAAVTRSLAQAFAPTIVVNGLALGAILPPSDGGPIPHYPQNVPARRWATPQEVDQALLFLLDGPAYMTGEIIHIDGGRHLV